MMFFSTISFVVFLHSFEALIDREWIQAGHPFRLRCTRSAFGRSIHGQESPIFTLFLDCTWQVRKTFPIVVQVFPHDLLTSFYNNLLVRLNSMIRF